MATKEFIENWLMQHCTTSVAHGCANGTGMTQLHQKVFGHLKNTKKADAVRDLARFYGDPKNIESIWNGSSGGLFPSTGLNEAEKVFVSSVVQFNGKEHKPTSKKMAKELGLEFKPDKRRYYAHSSDPFSRDYSYGNFHLVFLHLLKEHYPKTIVPLFFPGGREMPSFVLEVLKPLIPPFEYRYGAFEPGHKNRVICREGRIGDFAAVVRFAGGERLKVKPYSFDITTAKLAKMVKEIGFDEICDDNGRFSTPQDASRINDFKVALPLFVLSADIGLLEIEKTGNVIPGKKSLNLLSNPAHHLAKKLFETYVAKNNIFETHYITYISVRDGEHWLKWEECRKPVIDLLRTCPVSSWVEFGDFEKYMTMFHGEFFRKILNCAVFFQGLKTEYGYYGYTPGWSECEAQIIRLILSFLGAIGMLDIAYAEKTPRFKDVDDSFCVGIAGFRITPLGAWILGLTDKYEATDTLTLQHEEGGLVVQPDYMVIISGLKSRIAHESRLSGFLTKISSEDNISMYKIDFQSMVRAFNSGLEPRAVKTILEKASSRPMPVNVARSFDDWQAKVGKVKIRTVTVLETEDLPLLEELVHTRGIGPLLGDRITHAAIIADSKDQARVKAIAEKSGWLVKSPPQSGRRKRRT